MNVQDDPFFTYANISDLVVNFTNQIDQSVDSTDWVCETTNAPLSDWSFDGASQSRPFDVTYLMQSSKTSYCLGTVTNFDGALVIFSLEFSSFYPGESTGAFSQNVVGYAAMPCLIPCDPDQADGSPTNFVYDLKLVPDVEINGLVQTNGNIYGVDFSWNSPSTFVFQGSTDLLNWTNIAYIFSTPPETTWTTNDALNTYGQFFRVALVADGYSTNLPPINSALTLMHPDENSLSATPSAITGCRYSKNTVIVNLSAQPGQNLQVQALDRTGKNYQSQQVIANGTSASVEFSTDGLPNPVYFQAVLLP